MFGLSDHRGHGARRAGRRRRGTSVAFFLVILSLLTTGLIMTMGLASGVQAQMAGMTLRRDQAFYAAEAGIQHAYWMIQSNNNWRADATNPLTGSVGGATYTVTAIGGWNSPVLITAQGVAGNQAVSTINATVSPTVVVPAISLGNNFNNNGNVAITGNVEAKGNITSGGRFRLAGSLRAGGTISLNGDVTMTGTPVQHADGITVPSIDVAGLVAQATQRYHVPAGSGNGSKTYEVSTVDFGNGGIIYYDGPITFKGNVTVRGQGTLIVNGDVSISSAASFGSSSQKAVANIVTTGALDLQGYLGIVGSLYVGTTLTKNGGFDITGVIVAQQDLGSSGGMNITRAQPPWFDPRSAMSGGNTIVLSSFTGPIF